MSTTLAWLLFALGVLHVAVALAKFRDPLLAGLAAGVVGKFSEPEGRRTAFWFTMFGPMVMLAGQVAAHAAASGDMSLYRLVGGYLVAVSAIGTVVAPKSPFPLSLVISVLMVAAGYGVM
jgi:hypothetical protein